MSGIKSIGSLQFFIQETFSETAETSLALAREKKAALSEERNAQYDKQIAKQKLSFWDVAKVVLEVALNFIPLGGELLKLGAMAMKLVKASVAAIRVGLSFADQVEATKDKKEQLEFERDMEDLREDPVADDLMALQQTSRSLLSSVRIG